MNFDTIVGSLTDGEHKLEFKVPFEEDIGLRKGQKVTITGTLDRFPPGPQTLVVEKKEDIIIFPEEEILPFHVILSGFRNNIG